MFWTFKLSFRTLEDVLTIFVHFFQKLGEILINFLVTLMSNRRLMVKCISQTFNDIVGLYWVGFCWVGLGWVGLVWFGLVWFGLVWLYYVMLCYVRLG
jgi:hypothetical protein